MNSIRLAFSTVICLLVLYDPELKYLGFGPYLISALLLMFYLICFGWLESYDFRVLRQDFTVYGCLLIFLIGLVVVAAVNHGDLAISRGWLVYLGIVVPVFSILYWVAFVGDRPERLLTSVGLAAVLQSLFVFGELVSSNIYHWIGMFFERPSLAINSYRASGISSMTGDGLSFIQFLGFFSALTLVFFSSNLRLRFFWLVSCMMIVSSMIFIGRTGVALCIVYLIFLMLIKSRVLSVVAISFLAVLLLAVARFVEQVPASDFLFAIQHSMRPFVALMEGDLSLSPSLNDLVNNHLVFPASFESWVLGVGQWVTPEGYNFKGSDIGYVRLIWYSGLVGLGLFLLYFVPISYITVKLSGKYKVFFLAFFLSFLVANIKFPFLFWSQVVFFFLVMYFSVTRSGFKEVSIDRGCRDEYA